MENLALRRRTGCRTAFAEMRFLCGGLQIDRTASDRRPILPRGYQCGEALMEPQAQFPHAGRIIFADCKICPCSWSIEDDPSPETTHSSIDRWCLPFQYGMFLEYHLQYLGWKDLMYNK